MDENERKFKREEEARRRKKRSEIAYAELQEKRQKDEEERRTDISERKKKEIEFRKEIDAKGILSEIGARKETEMSTLQYIAKADSKRATRKIKGHPIIMFSTEKIFHCDRPVEQMQFIGTYYEKEQEESEEQER